METAVIIYTLWLITPAYAVPLASYPGRDGLEHCVKEENYIQQSSGIPPTQLQCIKGFK